jgi:hypothetical protein
MSLTIETRNQAYVIFNKVSDTACDFAEKLLGMGVDETVGRALCMEWASAKYKTPITMGQRGLRLPEGSAARMAMFRVVSFIWPSQTTPKKKAKRSKVDPIEALIKKINALTPQQRRRIRAAI